MNDTESSRSAATTRSTATTAGRLDEIWFLTSELEGERASSFRQERWCRIFLDAGARIVIFNVQGAFGLTETRCANEREFSAFRRERLAKTRPTSSVREGMAVRLARRIKHLFLVDLYLPNVVKLVWRCHRLLKARFGPVAVMASSPPFSVAIAGAILKHLHGDKVVLSVDMRDAWALHSALGGIRPVKRGIERRVLRRADHVTTVSYGLAEEFDRMYGVRVGVMYNVATHYLDAAPAVSIELTSVSPDIDGGRVQWVYTGSTPEGHYDVISIVGAVALMRQKHPALADRVQLVFVGACDEVRREAERQRIARRDIVFVPHVPHAVARSIQASAQALLFLAHHGEGNRGVVSTKLFEYLCLGRPVLPVSLYRSSDVDRLLQRYCGTSVNVHTAEEIMQIFAQVASDGPNTLPVLLDAARVRELVDDYRTQAHIILR